MDTKSPTYKLEDILKKVEELKKGGAIDLSAEEDLSIAVMNLVSLEEHLFFTGEKTGNAKYFDFINQVREIRKATLAKLIDRHLGETWCIGKHLLAASMRLMEVGTKLQGDSKKTEAKEMFDKSYSLYSLFWAVRLKLVDAEKFKGIAASDKPWTAQDIVAKLVNCCDE
ncbi:MAG: hypothetical protein A3D52_02465 [Candidatus Taylorbacteria bacterium RIFCSPHIGHO2_02_FULL_44_36]|uniref:Uncharacterized protein n=1 Tax=Candidatus Taylorbacteria bacterium RIFCSPLOWO2_12_FULL_44_15c TaxID=1802333 RepID=A0A1G2P7Q2_9BACT|nr:MAG: hypothetical protein A3D52_02465 [Candidatus Taylorbacteria bacterium RIFCSPHIGHO2_02_FULL_44_36]OHA38545.1 MAG: hypothetical protein A3I97_00940 [Candidatus Taylorbacteria bacterium RIFCSPLOWO2_02_FULL_44_35]OHA44384.1 MAG: hypothetical protein A3G03_00715 [Candidatus Taylorbacteria bacterium RIFCSPLOWO2_12_FULL_44_15c]